MTSFAESMKREIARVARKELKTELASLRKASAAHRTEIASLKRLVKTQSTALHQLVKLANKTGATVAKNASKAVPTARQPATQSATQSAQNAFSAAAFLAHRKRLGLTQKQMGKLVGASSLSIWKWESQGVVPRAKHLASIQAALKMGKRQALAVALD